MKILRFILYVIRKGRLRARPRNYESERRKILASSSAWSRRTIARSSPQSIPKNPFIYMIQSNVSYMRNAPQMNRMFYVSDSHQLVYLRILKCASTSILRGFLPLMDAEIDAAELDEVEIDALSFYFQRQHLEEGQQQFRRFAVVRNPFHRLVSVYLDLFDAGAKSFTYETYCFGILRRNMTFAAMVTAVSHVPSLLLGPHFAPQYDILEQSGGTQGVQVFRMETDGDVLAEFLEREGISLPHLNKYRPSYDYRTFYDARTFELVSKMYERDVRFFEYQTEAEELRQLTHG